jgi:hypothetical protein
MNKTSDERQDFAEQNETSTIVKCDVCGGHFNRRYLSSHERLAHSRSHNPGLSVEDEAQAEETILALYRAMSTKAKNKVLARLASMCEPP